VPGSPLQLTREDEDDEEIDISMTDLGLIDESMAMLSTTNNSAAFASNAPSHRHGSVNGTTSPTNMASSSAMAAASQAGAGVSGLQSPPALSTLGDLRGGGEHPYGEHPSRTLFVRNIHSSVDDEELRSLFSVRPFLQPAFICAILWLSLLSHLFVSLITTWLRLWWSWDTELRDGCEPADPQHVHAMQAPGIRDDLLF
jgi:hypothetical protein